MQWLKQSTAASLIVGPILDSSGAEYAGAVIGDLSISKNGGTLTVLASAATLTYAANGYYTLALTTGNTDTLGRADISCNKSTYQMPPRELMILPATVYDALTTNATNTTGGLVTATGAISALAGAVSTLTQAQVTGGAYAVSSSSCVLGDSRVANLDAAVTSRLAPTTAGRTLDVTATGAAGIDWSNIENNNATMVLGGTSMAQVNTVNYVDYLKGIADSDTNEWWIAPPQNGSEYFQLDLTGLYERLTATRAGYLDAAVSSRMATYTQPTGFLAATFPGTVASTTNITAGTITTTANLTNLPTAPTDWITAAAVSAAAVTKIQAGLSTYAGGDTAGTTTLLTRVTAAVALAGSSPAWYTAPLTSLGAAAPAGWINTAAFAAGATLPRATLVDTVTTNTDMLTAAAVVAALGTGTTLTSLATAAALATVAGYVDTEVAAIKAKTDNLPAAPAAVGDIPTAAQNAAAWGASVVGNSRTRDAYLQGFMNRTVFAADGLSYTLYAADDTTTLYVGTATRLASDVGGLRSIDPT